MYEGTAKKYGSFLIRLQTASRWLIGARRHIDEKIAPRRGAGDDLPVLDRTITHQATSASEGGQRRQTSMPRSCRPAIEWPCIDRRAIRALAYQFTLNPTL